MCVLLHTVASVSPIHFTACVISLVLASLLSYVRQILTLFTCSSVPGPNNERFVWYQCTIKGGREEVDLGALEFVRACEALGAGEIMLNSIDHGM